jgi:hypothetical protein
MRKFILFSNILLLLFSCENKPHISQINEKKSISMIKKSRNLLETVVSDFRQGSYFICIKIINSREKDFTIVIENNVLFNFLSKDDISLDEKSYSKKVLYSINNNKNLLVSESLFSKLELFKVNKKIVLPDSNIKVIYFNENNVLKHVNYEIEKKVIYDLFIKGVYMYRDDESGYIVIN